MQTTTRTWGPFSGRQLTTIICVVAATALLPVGAWAAVSFTNVAITDPGGVNRAKVNSGGYLYATVQGSVAANNAAPTNLYSNFSYAANSGVVHAVAAPPAGKALVVTSIVVNTWNDPTPGSGNHVQFRPSVTDASCTTTTSDPVLAVNPGSIGVTTIPITSGLVISANRALCAVESGVRADTAIYGYLVPAASAPPGRVAIDGPSR